MPDNRTALVDAVDGREVPQKPGLATVSPSGALWLRLAGAAVCVGALALAVWQQWSPRHTPAETRPRIMSQASGVTFDAAGRMVRVIGDDSESVLTAFCDGLPGRQIEALGVMPSATESTLTRIGVLRNLRKPDQPLAIAIRADRSSGRWCSGDGLRPLTPRSAPGKALQTVRRR